MSLVKHCDRCYRTEFETTKVLDYDYCPHCVSEVRAWHRASSRITRPTGNKLPSSASLSIANDLIKRDGYVTADAFGRATGLFGRAPYYALRYLVRLGHLETDRMLGGEVRFYSASKAKHAGAADAAE